MKSTAIVFLGIAAAFFLVMFIIFMAMSAHNYFTAYYDIYALAYGRTE